ncbi:hypothetical protein INR49_009790 [Caranx melampygus]|nr:hypothetical protein INR49_009790 [Caranx melampygus]
MTFVCREPGRMKQLLYVALNSHQPFEPCSYTPTPPIPASCPNQSQLPHCLIALTVYISGYHEAIVPSSPPVFAFQTI